MYNLRRRVQRQHINRHDDIPITSAGQKYEHIAHHTPNAASKNRTQLAELGPLALAHLQMAASVIALLGLSLLLDVAAAISQHPLVLLVAIDGFGYQYLERDQTSFIRQLKASGSSAEYMFNVFPTVTFPNFFSISTGLHPEVHGVIGNRAFNEHFRCLWENNDTSELFHYNEDVTPLWTLNELSGDGRYSATLGWPSTKFTYRNHPITYRDIDQLETSKEKIDKAIGYFLNETKPANLVFLYFGQLDAMGHQYGPNTLAVNNTLQEVDSLMKYLDDGLRSNNLHDKVNLILLGDHGMVELKQDKLIDFRDWLKNESYEACGESPYWQIKFKPGYEKEILEKLKSKAAELKTFDVYTKAEIPEKWHVKHTKRQADLLLLARPTYGFYDANHYLGDHGYDPFVEKGVLPLFIASGPAFKSKYEIPPFSNLDIFPLVSKMLKLDEPLIKPNGTITFIKDILKNP